MNQLKHLGDKLDFPDAAHPQLEILGEAPALHVLAEQALHAPQRVDRAEVEIATIDKGPEGFAEAGPQGQIPRRRPRLQERIALPFPTLAFVVGEGRLFMLDQGSALAEGAQAEIHPEHKALRRSRI